MIIRCQVVMMEHAEREQHDKVFANAVADFALFVANFTDDPDDIVDEESGLNGAQLHLIQHIVEDEVVDAEAAGKDWKLHHTL